MDSVRWFDTGFGLDKMTRHSSTTRRDRNVNTGSNWSLRWLRSSAEFSFTLLIIPKMDGSRVNMMFPNTAVVCSLKGFTIGFYYWFNFRILIENIILPLALIASRFLLILTVSLKSYHSLLCWCWKNFITAGCNCYGFSWNSPLSWHVHHIHSALNTKQKVKKQIKKTAEMVKSCCAISRTDFFFFLKSSKRFYRLVKRREAVWSNYFYDINKKNVPLLSNT